MANYKKSDPVTYGMMQEMFSQFNTGTSNRSFNSSYTVNDAGLKKAFEQRLKDELAAIEDTYQKEAKLFDQLQKSNEEAYKRGQISKDTYILRQEKNLNKLISAERQAALDKEAAEKRKNYDEERAIFLRQQNDYIKGDLNTKQKIVKNQIEIRETKIAAIQAEKEATKDLTKEQEDAFNQQIDNLRDEIKGLNEKNRLMTKAKLDAKVKNVPIDQKFAELSERTEHWQAERDKSKIKYDEEVATARSEFEQDPEKLESALASAKERFDNRNIEIDTEHGMTGGFGEMLKTGLGSVLGSSGGAIGESIKAVSDIVGPIKSIVKAVASGNPLGILVQIGMSIVKLFNKTMQTIKKGIEVYANVQNEYLGKINARLIGTEKDFGQLTSYLSNQMGSSPYVSQKALIEKMSDLVDSGVAYNLEQRTILASLSDRMVATFDMLDAHLTRLTRLQQADMSVAALGAEGTLNEFLNQTFEDTSYMSDMYDSIAETLLDASSQLNYEDSVAFNYNVQKWLGSLYSLGMSQGGVSTLAEGIVALATGNYSKFNGEDSLRNLFAMASGGSFSDLLLNGLNADNVDQLLGNIVTYLAQISGDTNQVVKSAKAGIFGGLSLSDIRAVYNMTEDDFNAIQNSQTTWSDAITKTSTDLLSAAESNTTIAIKISNVLDNILYNIGQEFVEGTTGKQGLLTKVLNKGISLISGSDLNINRYVLYELAGTLSQGGGLIGGIGTLAQNLLTSGSMFSVIQKAWDELKTAFTPLADILGLDMNSLVKDRGLAYTGASGISLGLSSSFTTSHTGSTADTSTQGVTNPYEEQYDTVSNAKGSVADNYDQYTRDINDLYRALFEEQLPMRVILVSVEQKAQENLAIETGGEGATGEYVRIKGMGGKLDDVTTVNRISSPVTVTGTVTCAI